MSNLTHCLIQAVIVSHTNQQASLEHTSSWHTVIFLLSDMSALITWDKVSLIPDNNIH